MVQLECPWCEEVVSAPPPSAEEEQTCPYCLTSWSYVETEPELMLAA